MATSEKPPSEHGEIINDTHSESMQSADASLTEAEIREQTLSQLVELRERFEHMTEIPTLLLDVPLKCLQLSTIQYMSYHLDPESDIQTDNDCFKDYRGLAEQIGLENIFIRFISRANYSMLKTAEVLSKWLTRTEPPAPTLGNLQAFLKAMERYDVLEDMSVKMAKDAVNWKMTEYEARTQNTIRSMEDTSWQLTRHDVVAEKKTFYTCCLLYADEDEAMAETLITLFKSVYPAISFFVPQFDLKAGSFVPKATVDVIDERCGGRVIFIISEYFFASALSKFAVEYCRNMDIENQKGNLIPLYLTNKREHVPRLLQGLAGINWYKKDRRADGLAMLVDSLLGGQIPENELKAIKANMLRLIERDPDIYLADAKYDTDIKEPGEPVPTYDPEPEVENSDDPSSRLFDPAENECLTSPPSSSSTPLGVSSERSRIRRIRHYIRKKIINRVFSSNRRVISSPPVPSGSDGDERLDMCT